MFFFLWGHLFFVLIFLPVLFAEFSETRILRQCSLKTHLSILCRLAAVFIICGFAFRYQVNFFTPSSLSSNSSLENASFSGFAANDCCFQTMESSIDSS